MTLPIVRDAAPIAVILLAGAPQSGTSSLLRQIAGEALASGHMVRVIHAAPQVWPAGVVPMLGENLESTAALLAQDPEMEVTLLCNLEPARGDALSQRRDRELFTSLHRLAQEREAVTRIYVARSYTSPGHLAADVASVREAYWLERTDPPFAQFRGIKQFEGSVLAHTLRFDREHGQFEQWT